jgi:outer membrane protein assembly factor BamB
MGLGKSIKGFAVILILTISFSSLALSRTGAAFAQPSSGDWPMFHANPSHTGVGSGNPVLTPTLLWNYTTGFQVESSPAVVNGVVYIGSDDGNVYALNAANGDKIWNYTTGSPPEIQIPGGAPPIPQNGVATSPAVVDGIVYVGALDYNVYALNAANGDKIWNYTTGYIVDSYPTVVNGVVYVGSLDDNIYALNATKGDQLWNFTTEGPVYSSPAVVSGVVYVGSDDGNVYALNATYGNKIWSYPTEAASMIGANWVVSSPAVVDGVVYVGSRDNNVYALNAVNGAKLWSYTTGGMVDSGPAVANGIVYVGSDDGNVYALNAAKGNKIWNYTTASSILSSNAVVSSPAVVDGVVYVGSDGGNVYALNATNGNKIWNYTTLIATISRVFSSGIISYTGNQIVASPAVDNGVVYAGSLDGNVYALGASPVSPSPISSGALPVVIAVVVAVVIVAAVVFLMFQKRLKTKTTSPPLTL